MEKIEFLFSTLQTGTEKYYGLFKESDMSGYYYHAADVDAMLAKVRALVEAANNQSITAKYLCLDLKGHGLALSEQLEKETSNLCKAIAAVEAALKE